MLTKTCLSKSQLIQFKNLQVFESSLMAHHASRAEAHLSRSGVEARHRSAAPTRMRRAAPASPPAPARAPPAPAHDDPRCRPERRTSVYYLCSNVLSKTRGNVYFMSVL